MELYPLKFRPILMQKVWGGERLKQYYRHDKPEMSKVGETWDVVALDEERDSEIINGFLQGNTLSELVEVYMGDLVGDKVYEKYGNYFPLMVKLIDAADRLSVQVHPNDELAHEYDEPAGKTEMWYVMKAEAGAQLMMGFNRQVCEEELHDMCHNGSVENVLQCYNVSAGDVFFIPAGMVHAIGKGCLMLEIQQASDVTYRMYDYLRKDINGQYRQLHIHESLEAIDYENWQGRKVGYELKTNEPVPLIECDKFVVNLIDLDKPKEYEIAAIDSFILLTCAEGHVTLQYEGDYQTITDGETVMIPASMNSLVLVPTVKSRLLETYIQQ